MSWITVFTKEEKEFSGFLDCSWSSLYWMEDLACLSCSSIINLQMKIVKTFRNKHVVHDLPDKLLIVKTLLWLLWELLEVGLLPLSHVSDISLPASPCWMLRAANTLWKLLWWASQVSSWPSNPIPLLLSSDLEPSTPPIVPVAVNSH